MPYSSFYDSLRYILSFGLGAAVNTAEEEDGLVSLQIKTVFVEQALALPGPAKKFLKGVQKYGGGGGQGPLDIV